MIHFTDHLRRLRVDQFEYAAMKVIILLSSGNVTLDIFSSLEILIFIGFVFLCVRLHFRHEWLEGIRERSKLSGIRPESTAAIHAIALPRRAVQVWRIAT